MKGGNDNEGGKGLEIEEIYIKMEVGCKVSCCDDRDVMDRNSISIIYAVVLIRDGTWKIKVSWNWTLPNADPRQTPCRRSSGPFRTDVASVRRRCQRPQDPGSKEECGASMS